jgi:uncharacterized protein (TIGR00661 family)
LRILYGIVGEGMGHATRSAVVLEHLLRSGHEVRVVVSGRAHGFIVERLQSFEKATIEEIAGLTLRYLGNRLKMTRSIFYNLQKAPKAIRKNIKVYRKVAEEGFEPQLVISDFESWAALYALRHRVPVISIDNMQIINRCKHDKRVTAAKGFDFRVARLAVRVKMPGAYHYLVSSFFFPPVRKRRTTLVPPILRPEVIAARREPGDHVVVYLRAADGRQLLDVLRKFPGPFRVYGTDGEAANGNLTLCEFSPTRFLDDLRTARAVIAGGGFTLMSEAVDLHVPMLSVPIERQYEQELNARYLQNLGYGTWAPRLTEQSVDSFLRKTDELAENLQGYERRDNSMLFDCLDELIDLRAKGKKRPKRLASPAMGKWSPE